VNATDRPDDTKPTIVLVHGAFADASSWNGVIERLLQQGYTVIAPANWSSWPPSPRRKAKPWEKRPAPPRTAS